MGDRPLLPLSALSDRQVERAILHEPGRSTVRDIEIGGPKDPADRRLFLDVETLEALLAQARASLTGRVVIHGIGLRVRTLLEDGHRWDVVYLLGREPVPETTQIEFPDLSGGRR